MKLKNKKTGEVYEMWSESANLGEPSVLALFPRGQVHPENKLYRYNSLAELNEEWEDAPEEPMYYWYIDADGNAMRCRRNDEYDNEAKQIGNYFETKEEAEKAVERLRAWKRLKDKGFRFSKQISKFDEDKGAWHFLMSAYCKEWNENIEADLDLLFSEVKNG